ncbi:MAG: ATP-binding protein [Oscillospiraceae bacterium]|nr:ATP-binding protein [Oscillospiraceae bacterium]
MIQRKEYLEQLAAWRDEKVIKVVTGIRRCGKSTLLAQYQEYLHTQGVASEQIIAINFEDLAYEELQNYKLLYQYLEERLQVGKMTYIFLDEIQKVPEYEKVVDSLYVKDHVDIYITGSNAYLLSGELATLLSGRYVEINMLPLSFREFCSVRQEANPDQLFADFLRIGSFPYVAMLDGTTEKVDIYLEGIYNTIIVKDIEDRQKRRETNPGKRKVSDISLLRNIARFLASSVGSPVSMKSIADYITSSGRSVSQNTVSDYVEALVEPYIFYPVERFDLVGKQLLKTNQKLYIADMGIRRYLLPRRNYDLGFSLENVIYLELRRRGYAVSVGKLGPLEVDFVAKKDDKYHYFQVTASLLEESTFQREITPLKKIPDNYQKTILTLDRLTPGDYDGITVQNAIDWLLPDLASPTSAD